MRCQNASKIPTPTIDFKAEKLGSKEADDLKNELSKLQTKQSQLLGKDLTGLSVKQLQLLEQQLNDGLFSVKERKEKLLMEQLEKSRIQELCAMLENETLRRHTNTKSQFLLVISLLNCYCNTFNNNLIADGGAQRLLPYKPFSISPVLSRILSHRKKILHKQRCCYLWQKKWNGELSKNERPGSTFKFHSNAFGNGLFKTAFPVELLEALSAVLPNVGGMIHGLSIYSMKLESKKNVEVIKQMVLGSEASATARKCV